MRLLKTSLFFLFLTIAGCSVSERLEEVKPLIEDFQALYNTRSFSAIYDDMAHPDLKTEMDIEVFEKNIADIRNLTGERISGNRTGFNWRSTTEEGTIVVVSFETKFVNGFGYETFSFKLDDKQLKLLGYNFKSSGDFKANQADSA
ncbi:hypothetical protein KFE96_08950 [Kordiimonas sp. SCSIO 12603]|uniref:hypothetical protein n=1 Tax=Kordiimonas sp. SCSIO 12603 TaxID=2829596 RepID=UPI00210262B4|nr:hypothetical protein [Kordiimonas sp. SCSIO 12603]UTW56996.1 hypothetical protein KFE96_08950 [Kordiimonas sp. SCSIO 12603]